MFCIEQYLYKYIVYRQVAKVPYNKIPIYH